MIIWSKAQLRKTNKQVDMWENYNTTVKIFPHRFSTFLSLSLSFSVSPGHFEASGKRGAKCEKKLSSTLGQSRERESDEHFILAVYCPSHMSVNLTVVVSLVVAEDSVVFTQGKADRSVTTKDTNANRISFNCSKGTLALTIIKLKIRDLITVKGCWARSAFFVSAFRPS